MLTNQKAIDMSMSAGMSRDVALLLLRVVFGGTMLIAHGWGKAEKLLAGGEIRFADPFGLGSEVSLALAVFAEVLCAGFLVIGLWTRWATIPLIITMAVALLVIHGDDPFAQQEKALLYLVAYLAILFLGPGRYAIDDHLPANRSTL